MGLASPVNPAQHNQCTTSTTSGVGSHGSIKPLVFNSNSYLTYLRMCSDLYNGPRANLVANSFPVRTELVEPSLKIGVLFIPPPSLLDWSS